MEGQPATIAAVRRLNTRRQHAHQTAHQLDELFALAVAELRDEQGWSARDLGAELGLGASTIHDWTRRGRLLR